MPKPRGRNQHVPDEREPEIDSYRCVRAAASAGKLALIVGLGLAHSGCGAAAAIPCQVDADCLSPTSSCDPATKTCNVDQGTKSRAFPPPPFNADAPSPYKADVLFMIDNAKGMAAVAAQLRTSLPAFFAPFIDAPSGSAPIFADLHIGVVTSDVGAGATGAPGCSRPPSFGDGGRLQGIGRKAPAGCKAPIGANYIHYVFDRDGAAGDNNLPPSQTLLQTLTCMTSVGEIGCQFAQPLESVYRALHQNLPENVGFLRDDALLVVIFVTNKDDGSTPSDSDVFDAKRSNQYGYEDSYSRQTRWGIVCGSPSVQPPDGPSQGDLQGCVPAPNLPAGTGPGKAWDISRYVDLFNKVPPRGGLKSNPADVLLFAIDAPETPLSVILSDPGTVAGVPYQVCDHLDMAADPPCVPVLQRSCINATNPAFYGDPAVRLNAVLRASSEYAPGAISSVCDGDDAPALTAIAKRTILKFHDGCIWEALLRDSHHPTCVTSADCAPTDVCALDETTMLPTCLQTDCDLKEMLLNRDGTLDAVPIPQCPNNGVNPGSSPCWRIEATSPEQCAGVSPNKVRLVVDRAGAPAPRYLDEGLWCRFR